MTDLITATRAAQAAGHSIIPIKSDGTKMPPFEWNIYRTSPASRPQITEWFKLSGYTGYGVICGANIEREGLGLELLDFDDRDTYQIFLDTAEAIGLGGIVDRIREGYEESTPDAGAHLPYFCSEFAGNTRLASRPGPDSERPRKQAPPLIETRGEGGYFIAAPSNGTVHPSGKAWRLISGGWDSIATIAPQERNDLWALARSFDQLPPRETGTPRQPKSADGDRPGDIFRQDHSTVSTFSPLVEKHGWRLIYERNGVGYYRRPGKDEGISATFGHAETDYFYVFTTSTEFDAGRGYNPFSVYVLLEHDGNVEAAVDEIAPPIPVFKMNPPKGEKQSPNGHETTEDVARYNLTDMGNAERLAALHGADIRHCHGTTRWYVWDGKRFEEDDSGAIVARTKETIRTIYIEAAAADDRIQRKAIAKHAQSSENASRITAAISLARSEPGIPVKVAELDHDHWLLNVSNGTIDLRTGKLRKHKQDDLITKMADVVFEPSAQCPQFLAFLDRVMDGDQSLITFLQRAIGYSLTGSTSERMILILYGEGKNGKSTLLEVIRSMLGDYALRTPTETLLQKRDQGIPNDVARLRGSRFVSASEAEEGQRLAEAKIKDMTGGDTISARFMRSEYFDFKPTFKIWLSTNHKPVIRGTDRAIWDRIRLVPFLVRIPPEEQDKHLHEKLMTEAPGILAWAVRGCLAWQTDGLTEPEGVTNATEGYRDEMDVTGGFINDLCVVGPSESATAYELYSAYHKWCEASGEFWVSKTEFGKRLNERGFDSVRGSGKKRPATWLGIGLRDNSNEE